MEKLVPYSAILLGGVLGMIILFYLIRGSIRLPNGRSGKRILRFTLNERSVHWFAAILFWLAVTLGLTLCISGLILTFPTWGRAES